MGNPGLYLRHFVLQILILEVNGKQLCPVFERMDEQLTVYTKKQKEKINLSVNNEQIVIVDLGMIHLDTEEVGIGKYIELCEQLEIRPNIKDFKELRSNIGGETKLATGSEPIPEPITKQYKVLVNYF